MPSQGEQFNSRASQVSSYSDSVLTTRKCEKPDASNEEIFNQRQNDESRREMEDTTTTPLSLSKSRCVVLVATVSGASFLNVSNLLPSS